MTAQNRLAEVDRALDDAGLTSDALRLSLYVQRLGPGWHLLKQPTLRILFNDRGEKPIRAARENAIERGFLAWRFGGAGGGYFRHRPAGETPEDAAAIDSQMGGDSGGAPGVIASQTGGNSRGRTPARAIGSRLGGDSAHRMRGCGANGSRSGANTEDAAAIDSQMGGDSAIDSHLGVNSSPPLARVRAASTTTTALTTTTTTAAGARTREEELLRTWLGAEAGAADELAACAFTPANWAGQVWGWYRPPGAAGETDGGGTQWRDLAPFGERAPAIVAKAIGDLALTGDGFNGRLFRGFIRGAIDDERDGGGRGRNGAGAAGGRRGSAGAAGAAAAGGADEHRARALASLGRD